MFGPASDVFENIPDEGVPEARRGSLGTNPDGLGSGGPVAGYPGVGHAPVGAYAEPVGGPVAFLEPPDASPDAALRSAGIASLVAAIAFGGGLALGGAWGGTSGVLLSGAAFNVYRAQKWWGSADASEKHEAVVSALFGAIGIAAGGYTAYKAYQGKT